MKNRKGHRAGRGLVVSLPSWTVLCFNLQQKAGGKGRRYGGVL